MKTIRIDGIDYELGTDAANQALSRWQAKTDAALEQAEKQNLSLAEANEKLQAKFDEAVATIAKKDAELAELPKKVAAQAKARAELEHQAVQVLGPKAKLDADDLKLRAQVISKLSPEAKLDGKSAAYLEARFDAGFEAFMKKKAKKKMGEEDDEDEDEKKMDANDEAREDIENVDEEGDAEDAGDRLDSSEAYLRMVKDSQSAWQRTLKKAGIEF